MSPCVVYRNFADYLECKRAEYGDRFDPSDLAPQFVPHFESGARVRVSLHWGETKHGTVGITTGWRPCFLLMHSRRCIGSSTTLSTTDTVSAVKVGRSYREIAQNE